LEDKELNQASSKPDPVNRPVRRTVCTIVHYYNSTQHCDTPTVFLIFSFLQSNSTSQIWPSGGKEDQHDKLVFISSIHSPIIITASHIISMTGKIRIVTSSRWQQAKHCFWSSVSVVMFVTL